MPDEKALKKWLVSICYRQFLMLLLKSNAVEESDAEPDEYGQEAQLLSASLKQRIAFSLVDMFGMQRNLRTPSVTASA